MKIFPTPDMHPRFIKYIALIVCVSAFWGTVNAQSPGYLPCKIVTTLVGTGTSGYSGDGGAASACHLNRPNCVLTDNSGAIYIADYGNNCIRKVNSSGIITTVAGTGTAGFSGDGGPATAATLNGPHKISFDTHGNLLIADCGNNRIRKVNTSGQISTAAGNGAAAFSGDGGPATSASLNNPYDVQADSNGSLYIADSYNQRIRKVDATGNIFTVAGSGSYGSTGGGFSGDGGPATNSKLKTPIGITLADSGSYYIVDNGNYRIRKVSPSGIMTTFAGTGYSGIIGDGGPATAARLVPIGLIKLPDGRLLLSNSYSTRIIYPNGLINGLAGTGTYGFTADGYNALSTLFNHIDATCVLNDGSVVIADELNNRIRKLSDTSFSLPPVTGSSRVYAGDTTNFTDSTAGGVWSRFDTLVALVDSTGRTIALTSGEEIITYSNATVCGTITATHELHIQPRGCNVITTIAGNGFGGITGNGGPAVYSSNLGPASVAFDRLGNMYFTDYNNNMVRKVTSSGIISTFAGTSYLGSSGDHGPATAARLNGPWGIATDNQNNVYIVDRANQRVRKVDTAGIITTIAGNGHRGYGGDRGPATAAFLSYPIGITVDPSGNIYIADAANSRIRKVNRAGIITTFAGTGVGGSGGDGGPATAAQFTFPEGLIWRPPGVLYVADEGNNEIRKIDIHGTITTIAGSTTSGFSGDGGPATAALLSSPGGVAADNSGNIYIADVSNGRVRKIDPSGIISTLSGDGSTSFSGDGGPSTAAALNHPNGVVTDDEGNLIVADLANYRVRKIWSGLPHIGAVTGRDSLCLSGSTTLADSTASGTWSCSSSSVATVSTSGTVTAVAAGISVISYSLSNYCGTNSSILPMGVYAAPVSGHITGTSGMCVGDTVTFADTAATSGGIWTTSLGNVMVLFEGVTVGNLAGPDTITYSASNLCGSATTSKPVTVYPILTAGTITGASSICTNDTTRFTVPSTGGSWFASNSSASISSGLVTGVATGTDTVFYVVSNVCGTDTATHAVTVNQLINPGVITGINSLCVGDIVVLTDTIPGGTWSVRNAHAAQTGGVVTGVSGGMDTLAYSFSNMCGTTNALFPVTIHALPNAGTITAVNHLCLGSTALLSEDVAGGHWSVSNSYGSITGTRFTGSYVGIDTVYYSVNDAYCSNRTKLAISIENPPVVDTIAGPYKICIGLSVPLTNSVGGGFWNASNSIASVSATGVVTAAGIGRDTITYTVTNLCTSVTTSKTITIEPIVTPAVTLRNLNDTSCVVRPITLHAEIANGGQAPIVAWYRNGVFAQQDTNFTYASAWGDRVSCTLYSSADCRTNDSTSDHTTINSLYPVTPRVTVYITHDTTLYTGEIIAFDAEPTYGGSAPTYQWYLNDNPVPGATNHTWSLTTYTESSVYCVMTSNLACIWKSTDTSAVRNVHVSHVGVSNMGQLANISLLPNPNNGSFELKGEVQGNANQNLHYDIYDAAGRELTNSDLTIENNKVSVKIQLAELANGSYFLKVRTDRESLVFKFIVER